VSQPWQEKTWPARGPRRGGAGPPGDPGRSWSGDRIVLTGESRRAEPPAPRPNPAGDRRGRPAAGPDQRPPARLTGRGAILGMLVVFFLGLLVASWLHWSPLAGGSFVLGCAAAARWTKPRDLLSVVVSPPALFFIALLGVKALTATGSVLISVAEGTVLTLADIAPWLFAGVAVSLIIACFRGLPQCIRDLRGRGR
jgi:uncharacterized protein DUF6542